MPANEPHANNRWMRDWDEDDEEKQQGNKDTRLAQAPLVREATDLGDARVARGVRDSESAIAAESIASTVIERATGSIAGSLTASTARQLLGAAAGMPLVEPGPRSPSALVPTASLVSRRTTRWPVRKRKRDPAPTIGLPGSAPTAEESLAINDGESRSVVVMEAPDVVVDRTADEAHQAAPRWRLLRPRVRRGWAISLRSTWASANDLPPKTACRSWMTRPAFVTRSSEVRRPSVPTRPWPKRLSDLADHRRRPTLNPPMNEPCSWAFEFLARNQSTDGSWSLTRFDRDHPQYKNQLNSDSAATGLALLAFQGAGYNHREFKYARQLDHAIDWLLENQDRDGGLFVETGTRSNKSCRLYSHAIAALALCEAFGMTQDPEREPAQKAIDYIVETQDPNRGGWRYYTQPKLRQTDTSVTGWMMMALQSGRLAGWRYPSQHLTASTAG